MNLNLPPTPTNLAKYETQTKEKWRKPKQGVSSAVVEPRARGKMPSLAPMGGQGRREKILPNSILKLRKVESKELSTHKNIYIN